MFDTTTERVGHLRGKLGAERASTGTCADGIFDERSAAGKVARRSGHESICTPGIHSGKEFPRGKRVVEGKFTYEG